MRAAYEILKFHRPQSRAIFGCDRPEARILLKILSLMQDQLIAQARPCTKFRPLRELQSGDPHPSPLTPHPSRRVSSVECRVSSVEKTQAVRSKIGKSLRQNLASGANFYFTAR